MKTEQLLHENVPLKKPVASVILVCDNIMSPANAGALIRLSDAFGIQKLFFCGKKIDMESNRLKKTARSTEKYVTISQENSILPLLKKLKSKGYNLAGLEITTSSMAIQNFIPTGHATALVLGNEQAGISHDVLPLLDQTLHIDMFGKNSSMNVSHAAAIAMYELTKPTTPHEK
ncbi:MAG TPA: TrmH family RNA methyltransferase [Leeuwenhoekiella sp.]|nr:TrmH family RNA methyltransferase [Leeuwenhoekiella sp.]